MSGETQGVWKRRQILLVVVGLSLALGGCGKKGPLEPPPGSPDAVKRPDSAAGAGITSLRGAGKRPPPVKRPKDDFFLDAIL